MATLRLWSPAGMLAAAAVSGAAVGVGVALGGRGPLPVAMAWGAIHLATVATGGLASPLVPLVAGWLVWLERALPRVRYVAAAAAVVLLLVSEWIRSGAVEPLGLLRMVLLLGLASMIPLLWRRREDVPASVPKPPSGGGVESTQVDSEVISSTLDLLRRAADAHEATLWVADRDGATAHLLGWSALPEHPTPPRHLELEGHPFGWAMLEQVHVHLERGRRTLPTPWASEMLLVPVDAPEGLLALAYAGVVPPGTEAVAWSASRSLSELLRLLRLRREKNETEGRLAAVSEAMQTLPAELHPERFAEKLAEVIRASTGADGAAIALWDEEQGRGTVILGRKEDRIRLPDEASFGEGESRLALALKHGVMLSYPDLKRQREELPLLAPGESWAGPVRSVMIWPLSTGGQAVGAAVAWHAAADRFGDRDEEFFRLVCSVAPLPLQSARKYDALDRRASTDGLTGLPNRVAFEARLAAASNHFERYERPFSVVILDVDHFKRFNDSWGHEAGDRVLQQVAEVMRSTVREVDLPARLGGEEFVVLLPETPLRDAMKTAERLRKNIESGTVMWSGRPLRITASFGVAACPESSQTPTEVLAAADAALYRSKENGRNRVTAAQRADLAEAGSSG